MLTKDPHKRLSVPKVLAHSWTVPPPADLHMHEVNRQSSLRSGAGDANNLSQFASAPGGLTVAMGEAVETARQAAADAERSGSDARTAESTTSLALGAAAEAAAGGGEGGAEISSGVSLSPAQAGVARKGRSLSIDKGKPAWGSKFSWLFGRQSSVPAEAHAEERLGSSAPGQNRMLQSQSFSTARRSSVPAEAHDEKALASWAVCQNQILDSQSFWTTHGHDRVWSAELPYAGGRDDGDASVIVEGGGDGVGEPARRHSMRSIAYPSEDGEVDGGHQHRSLGSSVDRGTLTGLDGGAAVFASTTSTSSDLRNLTSSRRKLLSRAYFNSASRAVHRTTASQVGPSIGSPPMGVRATSLSIEPAKDGVDPVVLGDSGHGKGRGRGRSSSLVGLGGGENAETLSGRLTQSKSTLDISLSSSFAATASTEAMPDVSRGEVSLTGGDVAFDICPFKILTAPAAGASDGRDSQQAARGLKTGQTMIQSPSTGTTMTMSPVHEGPELSEACDQTSSVRSSSEHSSTSTSPSTSTAAVENEDVLPGEAPSSPHSLHLPESPSAKESWTDGSSTDSMKMPVVLPLFSSATVKIPEGVVGAEVAHVAGVADSGAGPGPNPVAAGPVDALADVAPCLESSEVAKLRSPRKNPATRLDSLRKEQALPQGREESSGRTVRPGQRGLSPLRESSPPRRPSRQHQRAAQRTLSPYGRPSPGRRSLRGRGVSPGGGLSTAWSTSPAPRASPKWSLSPARSASSASSASLQREGRSALARWSSPSPASKGRGDVFAAAETTAPKPSSSSLQRAAPSAPEHGSRLSGSSRPSCQPPRGLVAHPSHDGEENQGENPSTRQHQERGRTLERLPRSTLERRSTSLPQRDGTPPPRSTASLSPSTQARMSGSKPITDADSGGTAGTPELKQPVASAIPTSGAPSPKPTRSLREAAAAADIWGGATTPVTRSVSYAFDADSARRHSSYAGVRRSGSYASMPRVDGVGRTSTVNTHRKDPSEHPSRVMTWSRSRGKGNRLHELGLPSSLFHSTGDGAGGGSRMSRGAVVATSGKQDGGDVAADMKKGRKRGKAFGRAVARIFGRRDGNPSARPKAGGRGLVL